MRRSIVSNLDKEGNLRLSQVRLRSPNLKKVVSMGLFKLNPKELSFHKPGVPRTPKKPDLVSHLAPSNLKSGASPQSLIGAMADEIQKEINFEPESADQIFASVNENIGIRLKNPTKTEVATSEKNIKVTATQVFDISDPISQPVHTKQVDIVVKEDSSKIIAKRDFAEEKSFEISLSPSPDLSIKERNSQKGKLSLKQGYNIKMNRIKDGGSYNDIIDDEFSSIHKKIDGIMDRMAIDKVLVEDDVHIAEDIERASLQKLTNRGIKSDIGDISEPREVDIRERVGSFGRRSSPEKINELRKQDHEFAK
jgi:hypothetical protein